MLKKVMTFFLLIFCSHSFSQELNCQVSVIVDARVEVSSVEKEVIEQMNKLTTSKADQKKYDELTVVKKGKFEKSVPYFEKAHELNPTDAETIKALWEVYRQLRMNEKAMEMKKKLDALPAPTTTSEIKAE